MTKQTIRVELTSTKKPKPDPNQLSFGRVFTDHMFVMDYAADKDGTIQESFLTNPFQWTRPQWSITTAKPCLKG